MDDIDIIQNKGRVARWRFCCHVTYHVSPRVQVLLKGCNVRFWITAQLCTGKKETALSVGVVWSFLPG